ncbi:hypothetical protein BSL82_11970 [Tardibacter chloracetimidivorans]|uniref:6-phosphogluconate dehydrogenase n=1 Tax=Tardibacter chloracetimidivorans TaxID=1921510 RepID=A0A1L3ZWD1_9SPHN|nr:NAD(P)-dependent oxidoreductase [Tardibacter chloracetimidivorans]API59938.1 hypothetical protein BSL82_11970 [Tardibacter chloracetimidivorans]
MKVGFIGIGSQGGGMAEMIARAGHELTLWARRPDVLPPYVALGARTAETPAGVAAGADVVGICVVSDKDVMEIVLEKGVLDAMPAGSILAIHSTVAIDTCLKIAELAAPKGVKVVDAPVSGSGEAALQRSLVVMVGGEADAIEKAGKVFESYSDRVIPLGELGSGLRAKIVNNFLFTGNAELARTALAMGVQMGINREALHECLLAASGRSFALTNIERMLRPEQVDHMTKLFSKDISLAIEAARSAGATTGTIEDAAKGLLKAFDDVRASRNGKNELAGYRNG